MVISMGKFIRRSLAVPKNDIVLIEAGCRDGKLTAGYLSGVSTRSVRCFSFEPDPRNAHEIRSKMTLPLQAVLVEQALSDENGVAAFFCSSGHHTNRPQQEHTGSSSLLVPKEHTRVFPTITFKDPVQVRVVRLDTFCEQNAIDHIDLVVADVQGAEKRLIDGATGILSQTKFLVMEICDDELYAGQLIADELVEYMRVRGFNVACRWKHDVAFYNSLLVSDVMLSKIMAKA